MHDPKFEKEVQQKMTELEFSPSESVWANVEKEINQLHTRRSFPFFWRLALPALLLLAGGGYYFFWSKPATVSPAYPVAATSTHTNPTAPATGKDAAANRNKQRRAAKPQRVKMQAATLQQKHNVHGGVRGSTGIRSTSTCIQHLRRNAAPASTRLIAPVARGSHIRTGRQTIKFIQTGAGGSATLAAAPDNTTTATRINTTATRTKRSTSIPITTHTHHPAVEASASESNAGGLATTSGSGSVMTEPAANGGNLASSAGRQHILFNPALAKLNSSTAAIHAGKLATKNTVAIKTLQSPHRPWEAAFAGGIGVSSLHQAQISNVTLNNAASSFSNTAATNTVTYAAARPSKQYVSTVKPGISFWAGVLANKPLSDRWSISLGLNLYYYSTRVRIGEQVNNYTPSSATLLTSSAVAPIQSYPYYNTGNDQAYTNRYYFMELPIAAEWKINRSHLLPLFWDGGLSVSYLMGSSAVYYNTKSGVYFKDGGVANHTQVNISTALMVGLPVKGLRVQVGPQVQYGLTPLLNTELSGSQHIFYGGLRLVVYPGKK